MAHREIVLGDGHGDALDVGLLEGIPAQLGGGHVAGESHHGHAVHVGGGDAGDQIGGAGAAGGQHHAGAAGGSGVAVRRVAGALLVGGEDVTHTVRIAVQLIVQIQHGAAGIAEDGVHPLLHQHLHENLRASEFHSLSPSPFLNIPKNSLCLPFLKRQRLSSALRYHSDWAVRPHSAGLQQGPAR